MFLIQKNKSESLLDLKNRIENAIAAIINLRPTRFILEKLDKKLQSIALIRVLPAKYNYLATSLLLIDNLKQNIIL